MGVVDEMIRMDLPKANDSSTNKNKMENNTWLEFWE
jgi:hypothetical protein